MNFLEKINKNNLHHGYLMVGERQTTKNMLMKFLVEELDVAIIGNPDFSFSEYNTVGIDEARALTETQGMMGFGEQDKSNEIRDTKIARKIFVISTNIITDEAQNALLKVFEEPTVGTHFFMLVSQNTFLPTFLSRLVVVKCDTHLRTHVNDTNGKEEKILEMPIADRLVMVAKLAGDISDEKSVKQDAIVLVNKIERELVQNGVEKNVDALKECQFARTSLFSRGAMVKMVLENLMLQI